MDIGHDPDLAAGKLGLIANGLDLLAGCLLQLGGVTDRSIIPRVTVQLNTAKTDVFLRLEYHIQGLLSIGADN